MADPNTRQGKRTPVTLKIKFKSETLEQFIERYAVDVSQGGIFIRTKEPLAVGTQMRFEFQLRDASPLIGGEGTVVWTRENDPSRPAIAPGMGVRFDRLAEGSQTVLERILAEKAKQAPLRPASETTKPPMFTDTPTKVAPAPVQDALLGNEQSKATQRRRPSSQPAGFNDQHTPLPKPMPFHSDADEFPEEAFEEATKVRALDELVAQTKDGGEGTGDDELAVRRSKEPFDPNQTLESGPVPRPIVDAPGRDSAPGLPSPPAMEPSAKLSSPRLLDTTPSPRSEADPVPAKTKLGVEPARPAMPSAPPPLGIKDSPTRPTGLRAVARESSASASMPTPKSSSAPLIILILLLLAAGGGAVWFFVFRDKAAPETTVADPGTGSTNPGSAGSAGSAIATNPGSAGSDVGSAKEPPKGDLVDTVIAVPDLKDKATVEIIGTDQKGPAPFTAKLEKDKAYKAKISAAGYQVAELDIKGGEKSEPVKLVAKPRVLKVTTDPDTAIIFVDGYAVKNAFTPHEIALTKQQAAKKTIRIRVQKIGYRAVEKAVDAATFKEGDTQIAATLHIRLEKAAVIRPPVGSGSGSGSAKDPGPGSGAGSGTPTPTPGSGAGSATPPEPEPEFKQP